MSASDPPSTVNWLECPSLRVFALVVLSAWSAQTPLPLMASPSHLCAASLMDRDSQPTLDSLPFTSFFFHDPCHYLSRSVHLSIWYLPSTLEYQLHEGKSVVCLTWRLLSAQ